MPVEQQAIASASSDAFSLSFLLPLPPSDLARTGGARAGGGGGGGDRSVSILPVWSE